MSEEEEQGPACTAGQTRELIEEIVNDGNPQEEVKDEPVENEDYMLRNVPQQIEEVKPKAKSKAKAKATATVKIIKEPVIETVIEPEPVIEEKPQKVDKLKETVKCPDCGVSMSQHTLKYIHKKGDIVKQLLKKQLLNQNRKSQHHHLDYKSHQHQII